MNMKGEECRENQNTDGGQITELFDFELVLTRHY